MPRLEYSERFANDLSAVTSERVKKLVMESLDNIELFGEYGSFLLPDSIRQEFGEGVRKVVVGPFDLIYTLYLEKDVARIEALVSQRAVR